MTSASIEQNIKMLNDDEQQAIKKCALILQSIWLGNIILVLIAVAFCYQFGSDYRDLMVQYNEGSTIGYGYIFLGVGSGIIFFSQTLKKYFIAGFAEKSTKKNTLSQTTAPILTRYTHSEHPFITRYSQAFIAAFFVANGIDIILPASYFLGVDLQILTIFTGLSALFLYTFRPTEKELTALAIKMKQQTL